jgi:fructose-1,6-bisphosphatase
MELHQRSPVFMGSREMVDKVEEYMKGSMKVTPIAAFAVTV